MLKYSWQIKVVLAIIFVIALKGISIADIDLGRKLACYLMWLAGAATYACFVVADMLEGNTYQIYKKYF